MILINDLDGHSKILRASIDKALNRVVSRGWFVLGPEVATFETQFAEYVGVAKAVSVANGTDALELALRAVGIGKGNLVATVANAGMYTTTALIAIGAQPFFIDVDQDSRTTTLQECERALAAGAKAIVVTHLYGRAAPDINAIAALCASHKIPLVEDCAQAHGAKVDGKMVGSFGDIACFSFYPTKNLGALGDGGAVATNNLQLAETVARLRQYGWSSKYQVTLANSRNSRLDEMQAAILSEFLPLLDSWNERRREIAKRYAVLIKNPAVQLPLFNGEDYVGHLYVIETKKPEGLRAHLKANQIASEVHYPIPDHKQPVFGEQFANTKLPITEKLAVTILTLPCYPELTDAQVSKVAEAVNSWMP
jgi:dTDP-3-amino-2,3,6-trideoxy-4-keto-D-glucose/dTDP-3-amino-3,4,6-trideoxy-alpha-D-glucose/dTDP-2,6-dideoxy-D-kanosamine transaminase